MRTRSTLGILGSLLTVVTLTASSPQQSITFQPQSKIWVEGTSTVRGFSCEATGVRGGVTPAGQGGLGAGDLEQAVRSAQVTIPVQSLDCRNGTMNGHLRNALKAADHPTIRYQLSQLDVLPAEGEEVGVRLAGQLEVAGQEKPITIDATVAREAGGALRVRGSKELRMTEFGVRPPTLMMGTMKVGDRVTVRFDVLLRS